MEIVLPSWIIWKVLSWVSPEDQWPYLENCWFNGTFFNQNLEVLVSGLVILIRDFMKFLASFFFLSFKKNDVEVIALQIK